MYVYFQISMVVVKGLTWGFVSDRKNDVHLRFTWPIQHFTNIVTKKGFFSNDIRTPLITDEGDATQWRIRVVKVNNTESYYITLHGFIYTDNITTKVNFSFEDKDSHKTKIGNEMELKKVNSVFNYVSSEGFTVNTDDKVIICCEVTINQKDADKTNEKLEDEMKEMLTHDDDMKKMMNNAGEYHSDVVLICQDAQVDCHKSILCLKSSYFKVTIIYNQLMIIQVNT